MKGQEDQIDQDKYDTDVYASLRTQTITNPQTSSPGPYMYDYNPPTQSTMQLPKFE